MKSMFFCIFGFLCVFLKKQTENIKKHDDDDDDVKICTLIYV